MLLPAAMSLLLLLLLSVGAPLIGIARWAINSTATRACGCVSMGPVKVRFAAPGFYGVHVLLRVQRSKAIKSVLC